MKVPLTPHIMNYNKHAVLKHSISSLLLDFGRFPAPNLCLLMEVVGVNVQAHWRDIGLGLGLKDQDLDLIQENNKHGVNPIQDCMRQVFVEWHSGATTTYSWKVLASILCSKMVNKPGLIPDIYSKLADEY